MPSLKDLKVRIASVKSTQKITKAMQLVAASKLRRAREYAESADPYAKRMDRMLTSLAQSVNISTAPKLLAGNGKDKKHLLVVVSADRGLCGGFNAHIAKKVKQKINDLRAQNKEFKILCIGKKAYEQLKAEYQDNVIEIIEGITKQKKIPFADADRIANKIITMFDKDEFDVCTLFYSMFYSAIAQKPVAQQIIPLEIKETANDNENVEEAKVIYEYEPNEEQILKDLLPKNISVQFYHAFLESAASEQGARMTAMDNATRNAGEMIKKLTLVYNRTRQANITKELIEIISGAEAL